MRALLVGSGGREHAIAWKLCRDEPTLDLLAVPGNPGIAEHARCVAATGNAAVVALARSEKVDLVVVGPEAPLAAGLADDLQMAGVRVFGPTRAAAEIETSKRFAKGLMQRAGVPTARAEFFSDPAAAQEAVRRFGAPVVIKASGLAAGKGVFVCSTIAEADRTIEMILRDGVFGASGSEILVEEFMEGEELSLFAICDGTNALPLLPAQDHKRLFEGDGGPNTGGMGAYAPVSLGTPALVSEAMDRVVMPTLAAMKNERREFRGLLYAGLMLTDDGLKVVEFNCRFGDPETQAVLPLMDSSLLEPVMTVATHGSLASAAAPAWHQGYAVTTVVAAEGYPENPRMGDPVELPHPPDDVLVFHAGTARGAGDALVTAGGRVLAATGIAASLDEAQRRATAYADSVQLRGKQLRRDIAWRELARHAGAT